MPPKSENKRYEATQIALFIDKLRRKAGFKSEGEFATAAGFLPSSLSDWKRKEHVATGYSLVRLITAASEKRATALYEAGEDLSPLVSLQRRLERVEDQLLATQALLARGFVALGVELPDALPHSEDARADGGNSQ